MLTELLGITAEWRALALALNIPLPEIQVIEFNHRGDVKTCVMKIVEKWFRLQPSKLSWNTLCTALRHPLVSHHDIAQAIECKYYKQIATLV